jgi:CHRD domain
MALALPPFWSRSNTRQWACKERGQLEMMRFAMNTRRTVMNGFLKSRGTSALKMLLLSLCAFVLFPLSLLLAACGTQGNAGNTALTLQNDATRGSEKASAVLLHAPIGAADLIWSRQDKKLTVTLQLSGLAPKSTHPAHIHAGTCQDHSGAILFMLPSIVADEHGQATMQTSISLDHLPAGPWIINIHNGPTMKTQNEQFAIACGQITMKDNHIDPLQEHIVLAGTTSPNEAAHGTAQLSLHNGDLTVTLILHGLAPKSKHAAHVHAGSCVQQGKVIFPLNPLVANDKGDASETMPFHNVQAIPPSGWYVNVHFTDIVSTQTGFNPVACGNVVLS